MGLVLCGLATLVAIPVLWFGSGSSVTVDASNASTAVGSAATPDESEGTPSTASAGSLLDEVDGTGLFEGGADASSIDEHHADGDSVAVTSSSVLIFSSTAIAAGPPPSRSAGSTSPAPSSRSAVPASGSALETSNAAASSDSSLDDSSVGTPSTAAPTTAAPATSPPSTAAPNTAAPTTAAPTTAVPTTAAAPSPGPTVAVAAADGDPSASAPTAAQWEALRQCESFGDYTIVSGNGLYHGAYQFGQATWNATARSAGRTDLVDVPPSEAGPAAQDAMALHLWTLRGWDPWPHCSREVG